MKMRIAPYKIIRTIKRHKENIQNASSELGLHRSTVWRWKKRSLLVNRRLLERNVFRLSTKPLKLQRKLTQEQRDAILRVHKQHQYDAQKIRHILGLPLSVSTIHRVLKKAGRVRKYGYHIRPYYQKTTHMHLKNTVTVGYLQMDVKYLTPELTGLPWTCFEYAMIDIYSRYKDAVILNQLDQDNAILAFLEMVKRFPMKTVFLQTDNGLEFQEKFHQIVLAQGLEHHHIHKNTPNENAVIERSFRTDEDEFFFFKYKGAQDYDDLRSQYAAYLHFYNTERPHLGINLQTPLQVVANVMKD